MKHVASLTETNVEMQDAEFRNQTLEEVTLDYVTTADDRAGEVVSEGPVFICPVRC